MVRLPQKRSGAMFRLLDNRNENRSDKCMMIQNKVVVLSYLSC